MYFVLEQQSEFQSRSVVSVIFCLYLQWPSTVQLHTVFHWEPRLSCMDLIQTAQDEQLVETKHEQVVENKQEQLGDLPSWQPPPSDRSLRNSAGHSVADQLVPSGDRSMTHCLQLPRDSRGLASSGRRPHQPDTPAERDTMGLPSQLP